MNRFNRIKNRLDILGDPVASFAVLAIAGALVAAGVRDRIGGGESSARKGTEIAARLESVAQGIGIFVTKEINRHPEEVIENTKDPYHVKNGKLIAISLPGGIITIEAHIKHGPNGELLPKSIYDLWIRQSSPGRGIESKSIHISRDSAFEKNPIEPWTAELGTSDGGIVTTYGNSSAEDLLNTLDITGQARSLADNVPIRGPAI